MAKKSFRPLSSTSFYSDANLVRYWTMDNLNEKNGNTLTNSGTSSVTGLFGNAYSSWTGNTGNGLYNNTLSGVAGGACTISCWIKINGNSQSNNDFNIAVADSYSTTSPYVMNTITFNQANTKVSFMRLKHLIAWQGASYTFSPWSWWNHYVYTYDGSSVRWYVNGALVAGPTTASWNGGSDANRIQGFSAMNNISGGSDATSIQVDDVAIFTRAMSGSEVAQIYADSVFSYALGESLPNSSTSVLMSFNNSDATDYSGNGNNGSPTNVSFVWGSNGSYAASMNGSSIRVFDGTWIQTTTSLTMAATVVFNSVPSTGQYYYVFVRWSEIGQWSWVCQSSLDSWVQKIVSIAHFWPDIWGQDAAVIWPAISAWVRYRVAWVYDSANSQFRFYANGTNYWTVSVTWGALRSDTNWIMVGNGFSWLYPIDGTIDEFTYDRSAWDDAKIRKDYTHSIGRFATI